MEVLLARGKGSQCAVYLDVRSRMNVVSRLGYNLLITRLAPLSETYKQP